MTAEVGDFEARRVGLSESDDVSASCWSWGRIGAGKVSFDPSA